jgi:hypothetical protein
VLFQPSNSAFSKAYPTAQSYSWLWSISLDARPAVISSGITTRSSVIPTRNRPRSTITGPFIAVLLVSISPFHALHSTLPHATRDLHTNQQQSRRVSNAAGCPTIANRYILRHGDATQGKCITWPPTATFRRETSPFSARIPPTGHGWVSPIPPSTPSESRWKARSESTTIRQPPAHIPCGMACTSAPCSSTQRERRVWGSNPGPTLWNAVPCADATRGGNRCSKASAPVDSTSVTAGDTK